MPRHYGILAALLFAVGVSLLRTPCMAGLACLAAGAMAAAAVWRGGASLRQLGRRLAAVNLFLLFLWLTLPLELAGRPDALLELGPLCFHATGLWLALCISLKANAIALCLLCLLDAASVTANARALQRLGLPRKLVTLLLLTHAHLGRLRREYAELFHAARLRGFAPGCSLRSLRVWGWLLGALLARSWQTSEAVAQAMRLRGFCGCFPLVSPQEDAAGTFVGRLRGWLVVLWGLAVPVLLHWCEWRGGGRWMQFWS